MGRDLTMESGMTVTAYLQGELGTRAVHHIRDWL